MTSKDRLLLRAATWSPLTRYSCSVLLILVIVIIWWFVSFRFLYTQIAVQNVHAQVVAKLNTKTQAIMVHPDPAVAHRLWRTQVPVSTCPSKQCAWAHQLTKLESVDKRSREDTISPATHKQFFVCSTVRELTALLVAQVNKQHLELEVYQATNQPQQVVWACAHAIYVKFSGDFFKSIKLLESLDSNSNIVLEQLEIESVDDQTVVCTLNATLYTEK